MADYRTYCNHCGNLTNFGGTHTLNCPTRQTGQTISGREAEGFESSNKIRTPGGVGSVAYGDELELGESEAEDAGGGGARQ